MTSETFFTEFGHLADAPNGVAKLRELILQLAVRGKLVKQDPNDEPASVLLERIRTERKSLEKKGILRKQKMLESIVDDELLYNLPDSWECVRIEETFQPISTSGCKVKTRDLVDAGDFPVVDQGQSHVAGYTNESDKVIRIPGPVVVFGDHTRAIKYVEFDFVAGADGVKILRPICIFEPYYFVVLKSYDLDDRGYGRHYKILLSNLFPLPPLEEQKRIVAKVDQLMALCDELEERQQRQKQGRVNLNNSALNALLNAQDADEFAEHWQRVCDNFDLLYDHPETIGKLRSSILQLAVQGRLVPQDAGDEPVSVLLEKIKAEKESLIQSGEIKKQKPSLSIGPEEVSYTPAPGHSLVRLLDVCRVITDGDHQAPPKTTDGIPFLVIGNVRSGQLNFEDTRYVKEDYFEALGSQRVPQFGDILYTVVGSYGISVLVDTETAFCVQRHIAIMKLSKWIDKRFLKYSLESSSVFTQATACATGIAQKTVPLSGLRKIVISLPPLEEQKRVVAKVDQLMALCDELEHQLNQTQTKAEKYAGAVVAEMTAA